MVATTMSNGFVVACEALQRSRRGREPAWLAPLRAAAMGRFAERGLPTLRDEAWRYTDVSPLGHVAFGRPDGAAERVTPADLRPFLWDEAAPRLVFVNGRRAAHLSCLGGLPPGVTVTGLAEAAWEARDGLGAHFERAAADHEQPFAALNAALFEDGACIRISRGTRLAEPLHVLHVAAAGPKAAVLCPRSLVVVEPGAELALVESFAAVGGAPYLDCPLTDVVVGEDAGFDHCRLVRESGAAYHVGALHIRQERASRVRSHCLSLDGRLTRNNISVVLAGEGAECALNGLYVLGGEQHVDNHLRVEHAAAHGTSRETFKGILAGRSRGVFTGRIIVRPGAQKTDGKQSNMSLLLSEQARVDTRPQLEIFADDVKCTHGATVGQIDRESLFYLRSRGLPEDAARSLLVHAFAADSLAGIRAAALRRHVHAALRRGLPQGDLFEDLP